MHDAFRASVEEGYDEALLHSCMTLQCFFVVFLNFLHLITHAEANRSPSVPSSERAARLELKDDVRGSILLSSSSSN